MYTYRTTIKIHNVDGAQRLFFADQFVLAHDAWEACLEAHGMSIARILSEYDYITPVVHAEADYAAALKLGDVVIVTVAGIKLGDHAFTVHYSVRTDRDTPIGQVTIVHAVVDKATGQSIAVPESLRELLVRIEVEERP